MIDPVGGFAAVERRIEAVLGDDRAARIVSRFFAETTGRAARRLDDGTVFLLTGDIPAMWLRDSSAQVMPFLRLDPSELDATARAEVEEFVVGVLRRQLEFIALDPYANAFNASPSGAGHKDVTDQGSNPWVWERKYEIDSLCFPLLLAYRTWRRYGRTDIFDERFWCAVERILDAWETEQDHDARSTYRFRRSRGPFRRPLERGEREQPSGLAVTGMTWSGFRPSDDPCRYGYNVPGNMFASVVLGQIVEIAAALGHPEPHAGSVERALQLRTAIDAGIRDHALIDDPAIGPRWAYEVDGRGTRLEIDDANIPSLLALPLIGYCDADDPMYVATRAFVLSDRNACYYRGRFASGIGSPHTPRRHVWPIALAAAALTGTDPADKRAAIDVLLATDAGTTRIHESFHVDRPKRWTRAWFSWAEAMFAELVLETCGYTYPETAARRTK